MHATLSLCAAANRQLFLNPPSINLAQLSDKRAFPRTSEEKPGRIYLNWLIVDIDDFVLRACQRMHVLVGIFGRKATAGSSDVSQISDWVVILDSLLHLPPAVDHRDC